MARGPATTRWSSLGYWSGPGGRLLGSIADLTLGLGCGGGCRFPLSGGVVWWGWSWYLCGGVMGRSVRLLVVAAFVVLGGCGSVVRDDAIVFNCFDDVGERACRINSNGSGFVELYPDVTVTQGPVLSPDRRWVSIDLGLGDPEGRGQGFLILDSEGEEVTFVHLGTAKLGGTGAVWSPDSQDVLFSAAGEVVVVSVDDGDREVVELSSSEFVDDMAVAPDGRRVAAVLRPNPPNEGDLVPPGSRLVVADLITGAVVPVDSVSDPGTSVGLLDWSPDGSVLAVLSGNRGALVLVDTESWGVVGVVDSGLGEGTLSGPSWSPDGDLLAYVRLSAVVVYDVAGGTSMEITRDPIQVGSGAPSWSPDGEWLVVTVYHAGDRDYGLMSVRPDGGDAERITRGVEGAGAQGQAWPMWS